MSATRRSFLAASAAAPLGFSQQGQAPRPHILWLIAEDLSPDLGCYGNKLVQTPHLDQLAATGVRFTRAYVTAPVCSASRSALMTGMYQTSIGAQHHRSHREDGYRLPAGVEPFTHRLQRAGYHTSNVTTAAPGVRGTGKTDFNYNVEHPFDGTDWAQRATNQPFYAQVNFHETHRNFARHPERPVNPDRVELPPYYPEHPAMRLDWAMYLDSAQHVDDEIGRILVRLREEELEENTIVFFFGDHGRPMPRDKQFLYEGGIRIPLMVRIPERYRPAGYQPGTVREDLVLSLDITATTLALAGAPGPATLQGRPLFGPQRQPREYVAAARDRCDETVDRIRCVVERRYKYIRNAYPDRPWTQPNTYKDTQYPPLRVMRDLQQAGKLTGPAAAFMAPRRPAEELYDLQADPHETRNLAGEASQAATLRRLSTTLDRWIRESGDQGAQPEPTSAQPAENPYRTQVDGWCTQGRVRVTPADQGMTASSEGGNGALLRSYVAPPGRYTLQLRARSTGMAVQRLTWGTITKPTDRRFVVPVTLPADGAWHDVEVPFEVADYLALVTLHTTGKGQMDIGRISVQKAG